MPEDFKELRGSPAYEDALKQFKFIARQYAYFYKKFQAMILRDYFTFDEYRWAVSTVMTRQNQVGNRAYPNTVGIQKLDI
jgi:histone-lysine N-methyltransferase SETD3